MARHARALRPDKTEGCRLWAEFLQGTNQAEVARRLEVTREMVRRLAQGKNGPSIELAQRIEHLSYGRVPLLSWITPRTDAAA